MRRLINIKGKFIPKLDEIFSFLNAIYLSIFQNFNLFLFQIF